MKNRRNLQHVLLIAAVLAALNVVAAYANSGQGQTTGNRMYDPKTETTLNGVVQEVKEIAGPGKGTGMHLKVKAGDAVYDVHVGPTWYLTQEKYTFVKGDQVEVVGSKVSYQGADAIIARQVKKGGNTWTLRDAQGIPLWSRGKSR